ncbi:MAG TPA: Xaa-Pro peptidase family protein [Solirubrobacteraceae bacterium]|jgi:Xaa-Pro aminopeptidase|nr:Xaa-Pro peptidase family protein [Solirubrobacteraceae bacterium]
MSPTASAQAVLDRTARLAGELRERELDALLIETPVNVRYVTGFTGSNALAVLFAVDGDGEDGFGAGQHRFLTDFRYATQSGVQVPQAFEREIVTGELLDAVGRSLPGARGRLGFDEASVSVARHRRLSELLGEAWQLVPFPGAVERLRAVKEPAEIELIRAACDLADEALEKVLEGGLAGRSERDVAIELELRMRRLGAEAASFAPIVAAGSHGALPHAQPTGEAIPRDVLVTIDWGALHEGYCSDCTRTFATGEAISEEAREVYALVLRSQEQGLAALRAGPSGRDVDAVARAVIDQGGHGEQFGHGLGHGVGMEVHEAPRLSRTAGEQPLQAGNVVSVEPGVYLPDGLGVRIEDLAVVEEGGCTVLTGLPKSLTVVS